MVVSLLFDGSGLTSAPMKFAASTPAFNRALSVEIAASEQIRMRVLAGTLAILLLADQLLFLFARETLEQIAGRSLPTWLPLKLLVQVGNYAVRNVTATISPP